MCVKEFFGFHCGHCTIPTIRQCPLACQNAEYPYCSFPAERPVHVPDYCHGCTRALWNMRVLKEEAEHKIRHEQGLCACEVVFTEEDRKRREAGDVKGGNKQVQHGNRQHHGEDHRQKATSYIGYLTADEGSTRSSDHAGTCIAIGGQSMNWYPREDQYHGVPFKNMIVGAGAVFKAGEPLGIPKYPSPPVHRSSREADKNLESPAVYECLGDFKLQDGAEISTGTCIRTPMVIGSGLYLSKRSNSTLSQ